MRTGPTGPTGDHGDHGAPALPDRIAARVPGTVHTDLLAAGLIPDPYLDSNELALDWIGRQRWRYRTSLSWTPDGNNHQDLVFEGLDTVATVLLDGTEIARTFDQHRTHRIPLAALLTEGLHELEVIFDPAWEYAEQVRDRLGDLPNAVQLHPQDGVQFRLGLGPDLGHRRHLAAGELAVLVHRKVFPASARSHGGG